MNNTLISQTLRKSLADWTDPDIAMYYVAVALGVAPDPGENWDNWGGKKWMFWSNNPMGNGLYEALEMLAKNGVLEKDEDEFRFRWNPQFNWEKYEKYSE